jgi:hypothetical protein
MSDDAKKQNEKAIVPVNYRVLPRTPSFYSNRTMLQQGESGEVLITFFEVIPPGFFNNSDDALEKLKTTGITADSQVRIILSPKSFLDFVQLASQWAKDVVPSLEQNKGE